MRAKGNRTEIEDRLRKSSQTLQRTIRFGLLLTAFLLVSCVKSCEEINYQCRGKNARATISQIVEHRRALGLLSSTYDLWYEFPSENSHKTLTTKTLLGAADAANYSVGQRIEIEYYGADAYTVSRIIGTGSYLWPAFVVLSFMTLIGTTVALTIQSKHEQRK